MCELQGETAQEVAGLAEAMQAKAVPVHTSCDGEHMAQEPFVLSETYQHTDKVPFSAEKLSLDVVTPSSMQRLLVMIKCFPAWLAAQPAG